MNTRLAAALVAAPIEPATPPLLMVDTLKVPAVRVVTPVCLLIPVNANVPVPVLVSLPVEVPELPAKVKVLALFSILKVVVVADPKVKFRSVEADAPVYNKVPVPKMRLDAALLDAPMEEFTPPFAS